MRIFTDSIDAAPVQDDDLSDGFIAWVTNIVSVLNEAFDVYDDAFNLLAAPPYTSTQISDLLTAGDLPDGVLLYDSTLNVYVGKEAGVLVKFTTTTYP